MQTLLICLFNTSDTGFLVCPYLRIPEKNAAFVREFRYTIGFFSNERQHETTSRRSCGVCEKVQTVIFEIKVSFSVIYRKKFLQFCKLSSLCFQRKTRKSVALQQVLANKKPRFRQNCLKTRFPIWLPLLDSNQRHTD